MEKGNSSSYWRLDTLWSVGKQNVQMSKCHVSLPWARIRDMFFYLVPLLHKKSDKMILHIGTNGSPFYSATEIVDESSKDKANPNLINAEVTELLQTNEEEITDPNIKEENLDKYGLHINNIGMRILAKSLLLSVQAI